jgi:glycosyltransferase involved in cell wall biosynthesis
MRIARVLTRLNLGGPARQVLASDPLLRARGHELRVYAGRAEVGEGDLGEQLVQRGIELERVRGLRRGLAPLRDLLALQRLRRALERYAPDVLHTHASKAGALGRRAVRRAPRIARVHTFHGHVLEGYFPRWIAERIAGHERALARETDCVIAVSHATADDLLRLRIVREEQLVVVPPGIELEEYLALERVRGACSSPPGPLRAELGCAAGSVLIGCVGRLAEVKRPELALEVFALIAGRHPAAQLVYVGDGALRGALEQRIAALAPELRARVHLLGAREHMLPVWRELDLALLCSRSEGLPVALIEAAAAALPAVALEVGGVGELVAHERSGWLAPDADHLAQALDQALASEALRLAHGARARLRARDRHGARHLAQRLEEVYERALRERRCAS